MTIKDRSDLLKTNAVRLRAFILENIAYDEDEGALYMRGYPRIRVPIEPENEHGRRPRVRIMGQAVAAAHVAFVAKTENWPPFPIRHINGDETDIRWHNLALAKAETDDEVNEMIVQMANDKFLADLRKYHPNGPLTYTIKSGKPVVFSQYRAPNGYGGGPSAMCADFV